MKLLASTIFSISLFPACLLCSAQQTGPKPVVRPTPASAPAPQDTLSAKPASASPPDPSPASPIDTPAQAAPPVSTPDTLPLTLPATSPATPPVAPSSKSALVSPEYVIGPEDALQITVWKEPTLSGNLPVRPDGMISLALVGDIPAAGLNPMQLSADIATRLKKYINDPSVTVTVLGVNSKHIFLIGEVQHVGAMPLTPGITPLQAIAAAGGITPFANAKHIYILRGEKGKQQKIPFDYKKAIKDGNQQGITLLSGDTIVVP